MLEGVYRGTHDTVICVQLESGKMQGKVPAPHSGSVAYSIQEVLNAVYLEKTNFQTRQPRRYYNTPYAYAS
jgi:hypothetical protein